MSLLCLRPCVEAVDTKTSKYTALKGPSYLLLLGSLGTQKQNKVDSNKKE